MKQKLRRKDLARIAAGVGGALGSSHDSYRHAEVERHNEPLQADHVVKPPKPKPSHAPPPPGFHYDDRMDHGLDLHLVHPQQPPEHYLEGNVTQNAPVPHDTQSPSALGLVDKPPSTSPPVNRDLTLEMQSRRVTAEITARAQNRSDHTGPADTALSLLNKARDHLREADSARGNSASTRADIAKHVDKLKTDIASIREQLDKARARSDAPLTRELEAMLKTLVSAQANLEALVASMPKTPAGSAAHPAAAATEQAAARQTATPEATVAMAEATVAAAANFVAEAVTTGAAARTRVGGEPATRPTLDHVETQLDQVRDLVVQLSPTTGTPATRSAALQSVQQATERLGQAIREAAALPLSQRATDAQRQEETRRLQGLVAAADRLAANIEAITPKASTGNFDQNQERPQAILEEQRESEATRAERTVRAEKIQTLEGPALIIELTPALKGVESRLRRLLQNSLRAGGTQA